MCSRDRAVILARPSSPLFRRMFGRKAPPSTGIACCLRPRLSGNRFALEKRASGSRRIRRASRGDLARARFSLGHHRRRLYGRPDPVQCTSPVPGGPSIDAILCAIQRPVNPHFCVVLSAQVHGAHPAHVTRTGSPLCHPAFTTSRNPLNSDSITAYGRATTGPAVSPGVSFSICCCAWLRNSSGCPILWNPSDVPPVPIMVIDP